MRAKGMAAVLAVASVLAPSIGIAQKSAPLGDHKLKAAPAVDEESGWTTRTESKPIAYPVRYELSRSVGAGRIVKKQAGKPGALLTHYRVRIVDGKVVAREKADVQRIEPVAEVFHVGRAGYTASRGSYDRGRVLTMHASAYDPSAGRGRFATGRTAMGIRAGYGVVAVDPRVIPLGTMVFVEGYGIAYACDTGGAIKGNRIDLCMPTRKQCMQFGRRSVRVHVLK